MVALDVQRLDNFAEHPDGFERAGKYLDRGRLRDRREEFDEARTGKFEDIQSMICPFSGSSEYSEILGSPVFRIFGIRQGSLRR